MEINEKRSKLEHIRENIDWQLVIFWLLAYTIAWSVAFIFGVDDALIKEKYSPIAATILIYLPKFAFTISGLVMFLYNKQGKTLWTRLTNWKVGWFWFLLAYLGPFVLYLASAWISSAGAGQTFSLRFQFPSSLWVLTLDAQSGILAYFFFRGGLGEEIGLRGFALPRLQARFTPLKASLIIAFWWGLWHLPAWVGRSALEIGIVWLGVIAFSMIFTWFYNYTKSLPVVILLHAALNSFDDVLEHLMPTLKQIDWELPYVGTVLLIGIGLLFFVNRSPRKLSLN